MYSYKVINGIQVDCNYILNEDGTLSITNNRTFYLKDKFVCTDSDCTNILSKKSKTNTCK